MGIDDVARLNPGGSKRQRIQAAVVGNRPVAVARLADALREDPSRQPAVRRRKHRDRHD